jgi:hypothetical protein
MRGGGEEKAMHGKAKTALRKWGGAVCPGVDQGLATLTWG